MADNYQVRDGNGNLVTFKSKDLGTAQIVQSVYTDETGTPFGATNPFTYRNNSSVVSVEFTRPSDTTAYAAKDVVCNSTSAPAVINFDNVARANNGTGLIVRARLMTDKKDVTARFRVHLYHTAPTAINDNSPYLLLYADVSKRIGVIDFPAMSSEDATNSTASSTMRPSSDGVYGTPNLWFQTAAADRDVYAILETLDAFTPASGQKFTVELAAVLD